VFFASFPWKDILVLAGFFICSSALALRVFNVKDI
jgi:hypothetical protein